MLESLFNKVASLKKNFYEKNKLVKKQSIIFNFYMVYFSKSRWISSHGCFPKTFIKMFPNDSRVRRNNTISKSKLLQAWKLGKSPIWLLVYVKCVGFNSQSVSYSTYKQIQKTQVKDLKMKIKLLLQNYLWLDF